MTEQEHTKFHERRFTIAGAIILLDLLLTPWCIYAYGSVDGAQVVLLPALPIAMIAITDWIAAGRPFKSCSCRWRPR